MSILDRPYFKSERSAFAHLERIVWADGVVCPHCGSLDRSGKLANVKDKKGRTRLGLRKCYECRSQFTVKVGTVFESAHIPLHKMLQAVYLICASKKGISAHQLHRTLEITYKSAWFLAHRIREAFRSGNLPPLGGEGKIIEADETYFGSKDEDHIPGMRRRRKGKPGPGGKAKILTIVERQGGSRSFKVESFKSEVVRRALVENSRPGTRLMTDEGMPMFSSWHGSGHFASHETVKHTAGEYARGDVTTNTVEGFFSIFKRGMRGVYQHCGERHLHRYLAEFDFRYSNRVGLGVNDEARANRAIKGIVGKRLTYRRPNKASGKKSDSINGLATH